MKLTKKRLKYFNFLRKTGIFLMLFFVILVVSEIWYIFNYHPSEELIPPATGRENLPEAVQKKWGAIYASARDEDYNALSLLVGAPFSYSFGGEIEGGFLQFLNQGESGGKLHAEIITTLLTMPHGKIGDVYVWPKVFTKSSPEWTDKDIKEMTQILTDDEIEGYRKFGGYAYYRLGIHSDGRWIYYITGD